MVGKKAIKVASLGTATQSGDDSLEKANSYVYITEQDMQGINVNNQQILTAIGQMQSSLESINQRIDDINKKEKEHWFWKNSKSPNTFASIVATILVMIIAKCNGFFDNYKALRDEHNDIKVQQMIRNEIAETKPNTQATSK